MVTVSVDEKPGVQAFAMVSPDLLSVLGKHHTVSRDFKCKRLGTASILAVMDLQDGHVIAWVHRPHWRREFIEPLKELNVHYPADASIWLVLGNHPPLFPKRPSTACLPGPTGSSMFIPQSTDSGSICFKPFIPKMSRTFLKHIRFQSWEELKQLNLKNDMDKINDYPVVHYWRNFDFETAK
ncbi:MAG: hypothetical protein ACYCT9_09260 [Leptospirillum sp.]